MWTCTHKVNVGVERHLKALKYLSRQKPYPKGFVVEGYIVYQSMVYISECLLEVESPNIDVPPIWDVESNTNMKGRFCWENVE